ncbi:glycosyltransferase [Sphingomonas sp. ASY06-1R]|uniref:glycosyltransferase n=1 Tax=Sphingomonas sp. ASY06-1R TaxID=3445771 RepID=UPI003FA2D963
MSEVTLISSVGKRIAPAIACVSEFEDVLREALNCSTVNLANGERPMHSERPALTIMVAISFAQLVQSLNKLGRDLPRSGVTVAYVFDAFLSPRLTRLPAQFRPLTRYYRALHRLDRIFTPMLGLREQQQAILRRSIDYLPIGVDALKYGSARTEDRWVSVNGYGRQPAGLTATLSDRFNRNRAGFFYHTDHMRISELTEINRHRAMFWQLLRSSRIALAYAPEAYDPAGRFECSFVGQRWFESLAAGCAVLGRRPSAPEADALLDWTDATIEISDEPSRALDEIGSLLGDRDRLEQITRRNFRETVARHDWRIRIEQMIADVAPALTAGASGAADRARERSRVS